MAQIAEPYIRRRAIRHLEKGRVVIFAGRHRQPVLHHRHRRGAAGRRDRGRRAAEGHPLGRRRRLHAPTRATIPTATKYDEVSYLEVMTQDLKVMDSTAITFCMDNELPIVVFDMSSPVRCGDRAGRATSAPSSTRSDQDADGPVDAGRAWVRWLP